ncbi:MAG: membrane-bound lytic murein transglycosylase MltF [Pseudomonadales bacterium]|nr:membrane-bound lytic murein transglycosylase MltF [Pseudomonadales bacterium]
MNSITWLIRTIMGAALAAGFLLVPACQPNLPLLEQVQQAGELIVATQEGPTTYYQEMDRETGFEFELAQAYADFLGVKLKIRTYSDLGDLLSAVRRGEVHMAAAGLTVTPQRSREFRFSSPYQQITQQLIYRSNQSAPKTVDDLTGKKLVVIANSSHSENLSRLQQQHPELIWEEKHNSSALALLNMVNDGQADFAVVDSNVFNTYRSVFPELRNSFELKDPEPLAWAFSSNTDASLFTSAELFFNEANESGALEELRIRFFGHREFDYVGARTFLAHLDSRLVKYEESFKNVAKELNIDWRLLAAIGYQESLWNPNAISPTGVRGLMMLTLRTAKEMGVTNRRDAEQSIVGGANYFSKLYKRLPDAIAEPNRTWFALAAYNVGYGHLMDARRLAKKDGLDPNNWFDVREKLPLLLKREVYSQTRHGRARSGAQSVVYVRNIRRYYEALVWATERDYHRYTPTPQSVVAMRDSLVH